MGNAVEDRAMAARLPEGDVIRLLLEQHARIRDLCDEVESSRDEHKHRAFEELRTLLAVHETAEEMVLRPISASIVGDRVAQARNHEEANQVLFELERMDSSAAEFDQEFARFKQAVADHAEKEEQEEFPRVISQCDIGTRLSMGRRIKAAEAIAPVYPHPHVAGSSTAQWPSGPFASIVDQAKDAIARAADH